MREWLLLVARKDDLGRLAWQPRHWKTISSLPSLQERFPGCLIERFANGCADDIYRNWRILAASFKDPQETIRSCPSKWS